MATRLLLAALIGAAGAQKTPVAAAWTVPPVLRALRDLAEQQQDAADAAQSARSAIDEFRRALDQQRKGLDEATRKADAELQKTIFTLTEQAAKALGDQEAARRAAEPLEAAVQRSSETAAGSRTHPAR